ncbi:MAG: hypothetical protein LBU44_03020 [Mediterranea sp.]|jgi:hypothetical protein|nr:hypothetical protein [Mediterranea sp.]
MGFFKMKKPRRFNLPYVYYDERKEKLAQMEENAKRELGMWPQKNINPEDIRGKFVESTTHLKRRKQSKRKPVHVGVVLAIIALLLLLWRYLQIGRWEF